MSCNDQGTQFELTVVQKFYQGSFPSRLRREGVIPARPVRRRLRGSFFVSPLEKQKRKYLLLEILLKYTAFLYYFNSTTR